MRTPTSLSNSLAAIVRRHFALTQAELADYLHLSPRQVEAVEAGRRQLSARLQRPPRWCRRAGFR